MFLNRRYFAFNLYNYTSKENPRVFMTLSKNGSKLGDLVFELYQNHCPETTSNFIAFCNGNNYFKKSYKGTTLDQGMPGIVMQGGKISECNLSAKGHRMYDENLKLRHYKRG